MKIANNSIVNAFLLFVLLLFVHSSMNAQCAVKRKVNASFEEQEVTFYKPDNGEVIRSIDLQKDNPYNKLYFKFRSIDPDYGMNAYQLTSRESNEYTEQILGASSRDTIAYVNSQVDVVIDKDCNAIVSYGLYRMSKEGEYLSFASTIQIYDQHGNLISEIADNNHLLTTPVFTKDYTYLLVRAHKIGSLESMRLIDLVSRKIIFELDRCEDERLTGPAKIRDSDLLMVSLISGKYAYDDKTYYVFDPQKKTISYLRVSKDKTRSIVGFYPIGLVIGRSKEKRKTLSYTKDFKNLKF